DIREAVVMLREDTPNEKQLVGYLVCSDETKIEINKLRSYLQEKLPDYMIPSSFVFLQQLPRSPQGKLDRKALPAPERGSTDEKPEQGLTPVEEIVAGIWSSVLRVESLSPADDFFEMGGHS